MINANFGVVYFILNNFFRIFGFLLYIRNETLQLYVSVIFISFNASSGIFIFFYTVIFSRTVKDASKKLLQRTATFATKSTKTTDARRLDQSKRSPSWASIPFSIA